MVRHSLTLVGGPVSTLIACGHKHPQSQMFRREGWRGYMGLPPKDLEYRGTIELRGDKRDSLSVAVTARNPSTDSVTVRIWQGCRATVEPNFSVRVYGPRHGLLRKRGHPVWTLDAWRQAQSKPVPHQTINGLEQVSVGSCPSVSYAYRFAAGGNRSLGTRSIAMRDVLGDSLAPGRYLVSALISGNSFDYVNETTIDEVDLRRPNR